MRFLSNYLCIYLYFYSNYTRAFHFFVFLWFSCGTVSSAVIHELLKQLVLAMRLCGQRCVWVVRSALSASLAQGDCNELYLRWQPSVTTLVFVFLNKYSLSQT